MDQPADKPINDPSNIDGLQTGAIIALTGLSPLNPHEGEIIDIQHVEEANGTILIVSGRKHTPDDNNIACPTDTRIKKKTNCVDAFAIFDGKIHLATIWPDDTQIAGYLNYPAISSDGARVAFEVGEPHGRHEAPAPHVRNLVRQSTELQRYPSSDKPFRSDGCHRTCGFLGWSWSGDSLFQSIAVGDGAARDGLASTELVVFDEFGEGAWLLPRAIRELPGSTFTSSHRPASADNRFVVLASTTGHWHTPEPHACPELSPKEGIDFNYWTSSNGPYCADVVLWDRLTSQGRSLTIVDGEPAPLGATFPTISPDGNYVAFRTLSGALAGLDERRVPAQIVLQDVRTDERIGVSVPSNDGLLGESYGPKFTADGQHLSFITSARLSPYDNDDALDLYIYTLADGSVRSATDSPHVQTRADIRTGTISSDGKHAYILTEEALIPEDVGESRTVYRIDIH